MAQNIFYIASVTTVAYLYKVYGNTITKTAANIRENILYVAIFIVTYFCVDVS